tara:strand:+ start:1533 stop:2525 length:993 start_codon:yes stop_codon:yes gene_type:complete
MVDSTQLERLNIVKARALVTRTFPEQDFDVEVKNSAVLISNEENTFVYAKNEKVSALAIALTIMDFGTSWNLILDEPDDKVLTQIAGLQDDCNLWIIDDDILAPHPQSGPDGIESQSIDPLIRRMLEDNHCVVTFEHGKVKGELKGLPIAEVVTEPSGESHLEVGVGTYDQEAHKLVNYNEPVETTLERISQEVSKYRHKDSVVHPLNRVARSNWLIHEVMSANSEIGVTDLERVPSPIEPMDVSDSLPASAIAKKNNQVILLTAYTGADLEAVPIAAQLLNSYTADEIWFLHPQKDDYSAIRRQAEHLKVPASFIPVLEPWPTAPDMNY